MSDQTAEHVSRSGLYPLLQSAYRAGHSTETALLRVQNDILLAMDRQHVTLLVLLDLSAVFDTVDHRMLLRRLEVTYGITGTALQWFRSYLTGRTQRVYINQTYSDDFPLPHGVPQASCLGPLLFMIYASKLFEVAKNHLPNILYISRIVLELVVGESEVHAVRVHLDEFEVSPVEVVVEELVVELEHAKLGKLVDYDAHLEWVVDDDLALAHLDLVRVTDLFEIIEPGRAKMFVDLILIPRVQGALLPLHPLDELAVSAVAQRFEDLSE